MPRHNLPQPNAPSVSVSVDGIRDAAVVTALRSLSDNVNEILQKVLFNDRPSNIIVQSPSGTVFSVSVSDAGEITATQL